MKIGVVQHRLRPTPAEDVRALADAVRSASEQGADLVVIPCVTGIVSDAIRDGVLAEVRELDLPCGLFAPTCYSPGSWGLVDSLCCMGRVGPVAAFAGDACFDPDAWAAAAERGPMIAVLSPASESDLQAEAALEVAIGLSDALCGLVIVSECTGAEPGEPGHGGSAVILLGEVAAEAFGDDDVIFAEVAAPVPQPEPRAPFPEVPTILAQRLALHAGRRLEVPYLADLSGGAQAR